MAEVRATLGAFIPLLFGGETVGQLEVTGGAPALAPQAA
jgi:hypothetical protein